MTLLMLGEIHDAGKDSLQDFELAYHPKNVHVLTRLGITLPFAPSDFSQLGDLGVPDTLPKRKKPIRNLHTILVGNSSNALKDRTLHEMVCVAPKPVNYVYLPRQLSVMDCFQEERIP